MTLRSDTRGPAQPRQSLPHGASLLSTPPDPPGGRGNRGTCLAAASRWSASALGPGRGARTQRPGRLSSGPDRSWAPGLEDTAAAVKPGGLGASSWWLRCPSCGRSPGRARRPPHSQTGQETARLRARLQGGSGPGTTKVARSAPAADRPVLGRRTIALRKPHYTNKHASLLVQRRGAQQGRPRHARRPGPRRPACPGPAAASPVSDPPFICDPPDVRRGKNIHLSHFKFKPAIYFWLRGLSLFSFDHRGIHDSEALYNDRAKAAMNY